MKSLLPAGRARMTNYEASEGDGLFVHAVGRAMQVLGAFHLADGPLSLTDVAALSGLNRSAAQRLLHTLGKLGYIRRDPGGRGYLPGIRLLDHTLDLLRLDPLVQRATPVLLELRKSVRERVDLSLFDEDRLIYALRMQSKRETFYATLVGHSVPLFCTAGGRAVLSAMDDDAVADHLARADLTPYTVRTECDPAAILEAVRIARRAGYAVVVEELLPGEVAIGVPLVRPGARPMGAIHVAGSLSEWEPDAFIRHAAPLATEAAQAILSSV